MESLRNFEWHRDVAGYRLVWLPPKGKKAFWIDRPSSVIWPKVHEIDRATELDVFPGETKGEKDILKRGAYIAGFRQTIHRRKSDETAHVEIVRPFETNELISLNLLKTAHTPQGWLDFTNKYGMIGRESIHEHWFLGGKDKYSFIYQVEHQGEWHRLTRVLSRIYNDYTAISKKDAVYLSRIIKWESDCEVREDRGIEIQGIKIRLPIAMRGCNENYLKHMNRPDVFVPAALSLRDYVNEYLEKSISLKLSFDTESLRFQASIHYGSFGAALVAEAIEFMAGHFEAKQCVVCGSWFRMGATQTRKDRIFCSAACKMREYRARKSNSAAESR
jgi:hypothetical protein